jgi:hypothetical protein
MIRVYIIYEGETEELFVKKILQPYFELKNILVLVRKPKRGFSYEGLKNVIIKTLNEDKNAYVTTLIDLYGMNNKYPGYEENKGNSNPFEKVKLIESAVFQDIINSALYNQKFIPHFQLHEFEAVLFTEPAIMQDWLSLDKTIPKDTFQNIRNNYETPEHINDSPQTAPSKQILQIAPFYDKTSDSISIVQDTGLHKIRKNCPHFNHWIEKIEALLIN